MHTITLNLSEEELKKRFYELKTRKDISDLLQVSDYQLRYHLYIYPQNKAYTQFEIPKKSGGFRIITAPQTSLKILQSKVNQIFTSIYKPKPSTHGFTIGKNVVTNAQKHLRQRYILNLDLQDFFPSINFGRVRGLLMANPYQCTEEVATVLAQICCYDNQLPQGSPSSPIISNMICAKLDSQLQSLAKKYQCIYTRYADDITFSTSRFKFPRHLVYFSTESEELVLGHELEKVIEENGFSVNKSKIRLQSKYGHQEVTGITVNEKLNVNRKYIRRIRAILHAWEKYGLEKTQTEFWQRYDQKHRLRKHKNSFETIVKNKIEFVGLVRGKDDQIYLNFLQWLAKLNPELVGESKIKNLLCEKSKKEQENYLIIPTIWTEGKTDIKHLQSAWNYLKSKKNYSIKLDFKDDLDPKKQGSSQLLTMCQQFSKHQQQIPMIAIFDRDETKYVREGHDDTRGFKDWKNGVYSFALPIPLHRQDLKEICIEHYYSDEEICQKDSNGRRLFLSHEFSKQSGRHISNLDLISIERKKIKTNQLKIIDDNVFDKEDNNIALSKNDFADHILNAKDGFSNFDFEAFHEVFQIIEKILNYHCDLVT